MKRQTHYICEGCGLDQTNQKTMKEHEIVCLNLVAKQKELDVNREKAADAFVKSIRYPEEIAPSTVEFMKKYNGLDFEIREERLRFDACVSNTHAAPNGKLMNWYRKPDLPYGYPGWNAHWIIGMSKQIYKLSHGFTGLFKDYSFRCFSDVQDKYYIPYIHFGSGGSWDKVGEQDEYLHYYMTFWADDFPYLKKCSTKLLLKT